MVSWVQYSLRKPEAHGRSLGAIVSIVYSAECVAARRKSQPVALLPLLVILFIVSYAILAMLVFEQGQTIETQRGLIRQLLRDNTQLAALKGKPARDDGKQVHDKASAEADHKDAPGNAAAGAKGPDKETKRPGKSARSTKETPGKPAADLEDVRRSTRVI
jgi:hypothetical protein